MAWYDCSDMDVLCDYGGPDGAVGGNKVLFVVDIDRKMHMYGLSSDGVTYRMISDKVVEEACEFEKKNSFLTQFFNAYKTCSMYNDKGESWSDFWYDFTWNQWSFLETHGFDKGRENAIGTALAAENFADLSDAMKVYVISGSEYFGCHEDKPDNLRGKDPNELDIDYLANTYGMVWSRKAGWKFNCSYDLKGKRMSKRLYTGKTAGVCEHYMYYENFIFTRLGIKVYQQTNSKLVHGWTVVKVKNSEGKTLWVPFDYGIGLSVVNTYKQAFAGIKGAPKKKTYSMEDFN